MATSEEGGLFSALMLINLPR